MISDYKILGIAETADISLIKKAYRQRVKDLHPDTSSDEDAVKNHFLFAEVCKAYKRLTEKCCAENSSLVSAKDQNSPRDPFQKEKRQGSTGFQAAGISQSSAVAVHKDPSYVLYKNGMNIFLKIHPSQWKTGNTGVIATEIGDDEESQKKSKELVIGLVRLFPKAYYYFSLVVNEYPDSPWYADSVEKMNLIEKRMNRYKKIIQSFSSWKDYKKMEKEADRKNGNY